MNARNVCLDNKKEDSIKHLWSLISVRGVLKSIMQRPGTMVVLHAPMGVPGTQEAFDTVQGVFELVQQSFFFFFPCFVAGKKRKGDAKTEKEKEKLLDMYGRTETRLPPLLELSNGGATLFSTLRSMQPVK